MRRISRRLAASLAAGLLFGCGDDPQQPQQPEPARVALAATFTNAAGGTVEAYTQSNTLWVQFTRSGSVVIEQTFPFDGTAAEVHVPVEVPLRETTETLVLQLELRRDAAPIFRGSTPVELTAGRTAQVQLTLQPVVATVSCAGPEVVLDAYGATAQLQAAALFATGDTIPDAPIAWSAGGAAAVTVDAATGVVTARADGTATITCSSAGVTGTRAARVLAVVTSVAVAPPTATVRIGATQTFTATLRDRLDNIVTGRTVTWTSARPAVASVNVTGTAQGLTADTTRIIAAAGSASGSALLTVMHLPPVVTTASAANVTGSTATVSGAVNPTGASTSAWFEYGTSPTLATSTPTAAQAVGSGNTAVTVSADLANLAPSTTYYFRTVASSAGGTTLGAIQSFTTLTPPTVATIGAAVSSGTSALLSGSANPNGVATTLYFEYGTDATLATFSTSFQRAIGSGSATVALDTTVTGLTPGTTYYFRAVATSAAGTTRGAIASFTTLTPPTVTTTGALVSSGTRALLSGTANPHGLATSMWFEYGTSPTLATYSTSLVRAIGSGNTVVAMDTSVTGLSAATTYYFRAAASNAGGTSRGAIQSFTTLSGPSVITLGSSFVTGNAAVLRGSVNPNGDLSTSVWFEYGTSPTLDTFTATSAGGVGSGTTSIPFNEELGSLTHSTTYYFRAAAQNAAALSRGAILSFTTLSPAAPVARTLGAYFPPVGTTFTHPVMAQGAVTPNGLETEVYFEFSPYDSTLTFNYYATGGTECVESTVCSIYSTQRLIYPAGEWEEFGFELGIFDDPCEGLATWVRAVATNALGTSRGTIYRLENRACVLFSSSAAPAAPRR